MAEKRSSEPNLLLEYPGVVATVFALGVVAAFLGTLYATSSTEHESKSEPAASAAPSSSAR